MRGFDEGEKRHTLLWFELALTDFYEQWKGKLIVGWPPPERVWYRRAHQNEFPVLAILEESALGGLPSTYEHSPGATTVARLAVVASIRRMSSDANHFASLKRPFLAIPISSVENYLNQDHADGFEAWVWSSWKSYHPLDICRCAVRAASLWSACIKECRHRTT